MHELISKNAVRIPVAIYAIGFMVHNLYLSSMNIYDFELIKSKYLYSGFSFILIVTIYILFVFIGLDLTNARKNLTIKNLYLWAYRVSLICIVFSLFFMENGEFNLNVPILYKSISLEVELKLLMVFSYFLFFITVVTNSEYRDEYKLRSRFTSFITLVSSPFVFVALILLVRQNEIFKSAFFFSVMIFILVVFLMASIADAEDGITVMHLDKATKKTVQSKYGTLLGYAGILVLALIILKIYSNTIYPMFPASWGGGMPVPATVKTADRSYTGMLISEGAAWTYIRDEESIFKVNTSNITEVKFEPVAVQK